MLGSGMSNSMAVGPVAGRRPKVSLKQGRSLMDWIRLGASGRDIQGFGGKFHTVTMEELAKHSQVDDCWMLLRGNVYNVTAYAEYHPGGIPELMRGAGKDGTEYFDEVHKWVNIESMLAKCLIGPIEITRSKKVSVSSSSSSFAVPATPRPSTSSSNGEVDSVREIMPRYEWFQTDEFVIISIYTRRKEVTSNALIVDCGDGKTYNCKILLQERYYQIHLALENEISSLKVLGPKNGSGKFEVRLGKAASGLKWNSIGEKLKNHDKMLNEKDRELEYRNCRVAGIETVTSDTKLFSIELPDRVCYRTPIGHHVLLQGDVQGMKISRNYTVALKNLDTTEAEKAEESGNTCLHIMIKIYDNGAFTPLLGKLKIGDTISMSDCTGDFKISRLEKAKSVYMIAAGTGLTPMLRLINYIIRDQETRRKASLLFANRRETDILWREKLDGIATKHSDLFKVEYILSRPPESWEGLSGRIDKNILTNYLLDVRKPEVEDEMLFCICGSTEFTRLVQGLLVDMDFSDSMIHCFLG